MKDLRSKIIKGIGGFYYVEPTDSILFKDQVLESKPRGRLKINDQKLKVGDIVMISQDEKTGQWIIEDVEDRKNTLVRPPVSNVDISLICIAAKNPNPDLSLLDKLLVNCLSRDIEPIICLTKSDLKDSKTDEMFQSYKDAGFIFLELSTLQEDDFDKLIELIKDKTAFMAGPSGAGKSTLSNRLCVKQMEVGEISKKLDRGKHTTRHVELLKTNYGSYLLDTPGFTSLEIEEEIEPEDLTYYYPEFQNRDCRFSNCQHLKEPGCGVREAVKNGEIDKSRYLRYKALHEYLKGRKKY